LGRSSSQLTCHMSALLSQPGTRPGIRPVIRDGRWRPTSYPGFPSPFGIPALASWASCSRPGIGLPLRSADRRGHLGAPDPDGVSTFRTHETRLGWAPSIPRGRRCLRDRPDVGGRRLPLHSGQPLSLRCHNPSPESSDDEASSRVHWYSPVQPFPHLWHPDGTGTLGLSPELRTQPLPATHVRAGTGLKHRPGVTSSA
jgi:hypothetical protein